jgi:hypothetical protein
MAGDAHVVLARITGATMGAAIAAGIVLLVLLGFWYVWPLADRLRLGGVGPFVATTGCFVTEIRPQSPPRSSSGL